ncbi:MAG: 4Fe-4S dicluster domain-containing protein [Firmicutes bacterium]|nr:4Fe-4S dicluster domain-containing protein [Bacillota bacterium]
MKDIQNLNNLKYSNFSRRSFLKGAMAIGGALALAGCQPETVTKTVTVTDNKTVTVTDTKTVTNTVTVTETVTKVEPAAPTVAQYPSDVPAYLVGASYILPDYTRCVGCQKCMIACSLEHYGIDDLYNSNIQVYAMNFKGAYVDIPVLCMKCRDNPCVKACPEKVGALTVDSKSGAIIIDHEKCTLCGLCIDACKEERAGVLRLSRQEDKVLGFCDMCGGTPQCVAVCPDNVLQIVSKGSSIDGRNFAKKPEVIGQQIWNLLYAVE